MAINNIKLLGRILFLLLLGAAFIGLLISEISSRDQTLQNKEFEELKKQVESLFILLANKYRGIIDFDNNTIKDLLMSDFKWSKQEIDQFFDSVSNEGSSFGKLQRAILHYFDGDFVNSLILLEELSVDSSELYIQGLSNSFIGNIYLYNVVLNEKDPGPYLLKSKNCFDELISMNIGNEEGFIAAIAANYMDLGAYYKYQKDYDLSEKNYVKARDYYTALNEYKKNEYSMNLGMVLNNMYILYNNWKKDGINPLLYLNQAIEYKKEALDKNPTVQNLDWLINSLNIKANYFVNNGYFDDAIDTFNDALDKTDHTIKINPSNDRFKIVKAKLLVDYGITFCKKWEKYGGSENHLEALSKLSAAETLLTQFDDSEEKYYLYTKLSCYYWKGVIYLQKNNFKKSKEFLLKSVEVNRKLIRSFPNNMDYSVCLANSYYRLAKIHFYLANDCKLAIHYAKLAVNLYEFNENSRKENETWINHCLALIAGCSQFQYKP